ncbi:hypothetical protein FC831_13920 [Clostridium botulinum]|nr:hypothetical protein [Clostridium botulinum]
MNEQETKFQGLVDKRNTLMLFGLYCNYPKYILNENYRTVETDYSSEFHKKIWGALINISKKYNPSKITALEIENELSLFKTSLDIWNINNGVQYIENAIKLTKDKEYNIDLYRDNVRKYSILRNSVEQLGMDVSFIYEEYDELDTFDNKLKDKEVKMKKFHDMKSDDVLKLITNKILDFKSLWNEEDTDNYSFHLGDGIVERIQSHKNQDNAWGYPFQSGYMTTIFRGMRGKKFMVRSSKSGGGKSRSSMAECGNIGCDKIYNWNKHDWISTGEKQPCLFISTELTKDEIQDCLIAHISGIEEDRIAEWKDITKEEEFIIFESGKIAEESLVYGEHMPDFTIDSISDCIERYILNYNIGHCFFDYINDSPSLYSYYIQKTGVRLQTHQILFLFSQSLKNLANKYNIYLGSATQLSSNWKEEKDANALKGSKAIIEKADYGVIGLPATPQDLKKLKPILDSNLTKEPNYCYHVFKNRGGRWNTIIVWTRLNMGTMREVDCFVTNEDYEIITDIEKTTLDFSFEIEDVGDVTTFENESELNAKEFITELNKTKL